MKQFQTFIFDSVAFDPAKGEIVLKYSLDDEIAFVETITLPRQPEHSSAGLLTCENVPAAALDAALFALHIIGGVSYYKTCLPKKMEIRSGTLDASQAAFFTAVYENGLGEFFYRNDTDFHDLIHFPIALNHPPVSARPARACGVRGERGNKRRTLVPIGGGKDSIVTIERLRKEGTDIALLRMGAHPLVDDLDKITGLPCITVGRRLSSRLFELNEQGALNGHVPVTAYLSALCIVIAELQGFDAIAMSNEKSANAGNVPFKGKVINHQWSKSTEFERLFQQYIANSIDPDLRYGSALRDRTELEIAEEFCAYPQYFEAFTSCNRNWKILKEKGSGATWPRSGSPWCRRCPKCAFVFAALAAYLPRSALQGIFGAILYDDDALIPLYRQILGREGFKPFECVGTPEETRQAFDLAHARGDLDDTPVMKMYRAGA